MGDDDLNGLKIILDTCHGSAATCAEKIFKKLGASVKVIHNELIGTKINLNCGSTCLDPIKKAVIENNADMGFSFDGDADRVIGHLKGMYWMDYSFLLVDSRKKIYHNNLIISTKWQI